MLTKDPLRRTDKSTSPSLCRRVYNRYPSQYYIVRLQLFLKDIYLRDLRLTIYYTYKQQC